MTTWCAGWAAAWFELLAVVLELIMNTKLIYIARHTARGGKVHRLKPTIFWFGGKGPWYCFAPCNTMVFISGCCDLCQVQQYSWSQAGLVSVDLE